MLLFLGSGKEMSDFILPSGDDPERLRRRLELRRSSASSPHKNKRLLARKGIGKGGRGSSKRRAVEDY